MLILFRSFWDTQSEIDRMFNDMLSNFIGTRRRGTQQLWAPRLEAFAKDGDLVLHYDLPGVGLEDVDITLDGNVLTISGERLLSRPWRYRRQRRYCCASLDAGAPSQEHPTLTTSPLVSRTTPARLFPMPAPEESTGRRRRCRTSLSIIVRSAV